MPPIEYIEEKTVFDTTAALEYTPLVQISEDCNMMLF